MPESLPPELQELAASARQLVADLTKLEAELPDDPDAEVPRTLAARARDCARERGIYGLTQPAEFGGLEGGPLALTVVREALAHGHLRLARFALGPGPGVLARADGRLRRDYLQPLMRGEKRSAFAFTEPEDAPPTRARRDGDGFRVDGIKSYVTGGAQADFVCALVRVEPDGDAPAGPAMLVIDRRAPGVEVVRTFHSLDGSGHVSLAFRDVAVPGDQLIGAVGEGMPRALRSIGDTRLALAAHASGLIQWALDFLTAHLRAPHRSGAPLGEREGVRLRLADLLIEAYAGRSMLYRTARLAQAGEDVRNEGQATKVFLTERVGAVIDTAVQLAGGEALVRGHPLERAYREVRALRLAEGASDLLRLNLSRGRLEFDAVRV